MWQALTACGITCLRLSAFKSQWPYFFANLDSFVQATDHAADASVVELDVESGDLIVAGSDGLWDNMPEAEILERLPRSQAETEQVCRVLAAVRQNCVGLAWCAAE